MIFVTQAVNNQLSLKQFHASETALCAFNIEKYMYNQQ